MSRFFSARSASAPGPLDRGARRLYAALLFAARWFESGPARGARSALCLLLASLYAWTLAWTVQASGLLNFTTDSWSYFELSKTVFRGDFYAFSTLRSYVSPMYSAAFPPLYPALLALVGLLPGGGSPLGAVWLNLGLALVSGALVLALARRLGLPWLLAGLLALSLLLAPGYLDELLSGRSVPAAVCLLLLAALSWTSGRFWLSGLCLGLMALTRFDLLSVALLALLLSLVLTPGTLASRLRARWPLLAGALLGASPWVVFSLLHFHTLWASDNAWVAFSALPVFNLDFPARPALTAFRAPELFASRLLGNAAPLWQGVTLTAGSWPLWLLGAAFLASLPGLSVRLRLQAALSLLALTASLLPFLLTGYAEARYFTPHLLLLSFGLAVFACRSASLARFQGVFLLLCACVCLGTLRAGADMLGSRAADGVWATLHPDPASVQILQVQACLRFNRGAVPVFSGGSQGLGARYGAVTGGRSVLIASNLPRMTSAQKEAYFASLRPFLLFQNPRSLPACPRLDASE